MLYNGGKFGAKGDRMLTAGMGRDDLEMREWLTVNGQGGFASGTISGIATRRYHALLIASLPPPQNRQMLLGDVDITIDDGTTRTSLAAHRYADDTLYPDGWRLIQQYENWPVPTWTYQLPDGSHLIKQVFLGRGSNTVYVTVRLEDGTKPLRLTFSPLVAWRSYHAQQRQWPGFPRQSDAATGGWQVQADKNAPVLRLLVDGATWTRADWWNRNLRHTRELQRGFDSDEDLYCPATAQVTLHPHETVTFTATVEDSAPDTAEVILARHVAHQEQVLQTAGNPVSAALRDLLLSGDQCLIRTPSGRLTIIAGYPWFTDWGRDTMIALPGLCLATKRYDEAKEILLGFGDYVSKGMIPNRFPDQGETPEYNTVDATLWWFHACDLYLRQTGDSSFRDTLLPVFSNILDWHVRGTRYRIRMDPDDALLSCGEPGVQLTWMDAKVGDWVVTPRRGKPVEINALWIHALEICRRWCQESKQMEGAHRWAGVADRAREAFRHRFVRLDGKGLYDVLPPDGPPDTAIRPNQVVAVILEPSLLTDVQARSVVDTVHKELLTPYGLRTLSTQNPLYQGRYQGSPRARDSAYHQGTVWPYLLGVFADASRRLQGPDFDPSPLFAPLLAVRSDFGIAGVAEVFDGDAPQHPDGCPWQAWSIGEALRLLLPATESGARTPVPAAL